MAKPNKKLILGDDLANTLLGTDDSESIFGQGGNDTISAAGGNDIVSGGVGNDVVNGSRGDDSLSGDGGNDNLVGEHGNDRLAGGDDNDLLFGNDGNDVLTGGAGHDIFMFAHGDGVDHITDFTSQDRIDLGAFHFASPQAVLDAFKQQGPNAVLDFGNGNKLFLDNTDVGTLSASQFNVLPYLLPSNPDVSFTTLMTVGDHVGADTMVGIPDGLGAFDNGDGTFTVLMNHELTPTEGVPRDHGSAGAFVSRLVIDKSTLEVIQSSDLIQTIHQYDPVTHSYFEATTAFNRLCSADLADATAFYNPDSGLGYNGGRLFLDGEESGNEGRAFAHIASGPEAGNSYELAWLGNMAYENVVANPTSGDKTIVGLTDDTSPLGQVYFYSGTKSASGNAVEMAGLTSGNLLGVHVVDFEGLANNEPNVALPLGADRESAFTMVNLGDVSGLTGAQINGNSETIGVTEFLRPEDCAWDTINPDRFYFVTTNAFNAPSRLWALDFTDSANPALGGTIKVLLDGTEGQQMFDNITVNQDGHVILCEDVGNQAHVGKVWDYDPVTDTLIQLAQHDPSRFAPGGDFFLTQDEETSGVVDVTDILGSGTQNAYLIDVQAHYNLGGELVQGGQLMVMFQDHLV
jgi:hemolysin type calcium-binding protein